MTANICKMLDYTHVLRFVATQSNEIARFNPYGGGYEMSQPLLQGGAGAKIAYMAGTINEGEEMIRMQRLLYRITRGQCLSLFSEPFTQ